VLGVLPSLEAHPAQICFGAQNTVKEHSFNGGICAPGTLPALMDEEPGGPPLHILEDRNHGVVELGPAHRTGHRGGILLFVLGPHLKTLAVQTVLALLALRVALRVQLLVADRTRIFVTDCWESVITLDVPLDLAPAQRSVHDRCLLLLRELQLDQPIEFIVQIRGCFTMGCTLPQNRVVF
jgi:hypothetical protein